MLSPISTSDAKVFITFFTRVEFNQTNILWFLFLYHQFCFSQNFMSKLTIEVMSNCHTLISTSSMYGIPHLLPKNLQKVLRTRNWYYHSVGIIFFSVMLPLVFAMSTVAGIRFIAMVFSLHLQILMLFRCCMTSHFFIMTYKTCNRHIRIHLERRIFLNNKVFLLEAR